MRKAVLEGNILPKSKGRVLIDGYTSAEIITLSRDVINYQLGVIELPDQTRVPGGRRRSGEFTMTLQFGRDYDRLTIMDWASKCTDGGTVNSGIASDYKRDMTLIYCRLIDSNDTKDQTNGNTTVSNVKARVIGCWVSQYSFPDYDITADEGDGHSVLEVTIQYDDVIPDIYSGIENIIGNTSPELSRRNVAPRNVLGSGLLGS